mmetsp:Transcript_115547/g.368738  ORF Transcript_115547/g.368738 Transcript_115547/m.368738 type:complete len:350 (+) Transcript_115547:170-1219(+)
MLRRMKAGRATAEVQTGRQRKLAATRGGRRGPSARESPSLPLRVLRRQRGEEGARVVQELLRGRELRHLARREDEHLVGVRDGADPVSDAQHGPRGELLADGPLDQAVGVHVHRGGRLVEQQDLAGPEQRAPQAGHLPLAHGEVLSALRHRGVEVALQLLDVQLQVAAAQRLPDLLVGADPNGVHVEADVPNKHDRLLWDDRHAPTQALQPKLGDVDTVDVDVAARKLREPKQAVHHGGLARARPARDADLLSCLDGEGYALQDQGQLRAIAEGDLVECNLAALWPARHVLVRRVGGLRRVAQVFGHALHGHNVGLTVGGHPDNPVQRLGHGDRVGHGQPDDARGNACA